MKRAFPPMLIGLCLIAIFLLGIAPRRPAKAAPPAQAGRGAIRVAASGTDTPGCGSAATPCASGQFAVDQAAPGDGLGGAATATVRLTVLPANDAPHVGTPATLYDGSLGTSPAAQGFALVTSPLFGASAQETVLTDGVRLDTTPAATDYAGYFGLSPVTLNRLDGFSVQFTLHISAETHAGSDKNGDGLDDRAGFSVIAIAGDGRGIELGFWASQIWAQNDGPAEPPPNSNTLFTHAESASFDTTGQTRYELTVQGDAYTLTGDGAFILHGRLRDYGAAVVPFPINPYTTPNLIFMGDDTPSASADFALNGVTIVTGAPPADRSALTNTDLPLDDIRLFDIDAGGQTVALTLTVSHGTLLVTMTAPGGLSAGHISGNGGRSVVLTGPIGQMNATLAHTPTLVYHSDLGFTGVDTLTITLDDRGASGGPPLTDTHRLRITVDGPPPASLRIYLPLIMNISNYDFGF